MEQGVHWPPSMGVLHRLLEKLLFNLSYRERTRSLCSLSRRKMLRQTPTRVADIRYCIGIPCETVCPCVYIFHI